MADSLSNLKHHAALLLCILFLLVPGSRGTVALAETHSNVSTNGTFHEVSSPQKPALVAKELAPNIGSYSVLDSKGSICIKASMAVEYVVPQAKKNLYYNIDPFFTKASGFCRENTSNLSLTFGGGNVEFIFLKEGNVSYVSEIRANLQASPNCKHCRSEKYTGALSNGKLFRAEDGLSYKCNSKTTLQMAGTLQIKIMKLRIQAFNIINGQFGNVEECLPDYIKKIIPLIVGGSVVGVCLMALVAFLIIREHRVQGYERI